MAEQLIPAPVTAAPKPPSTPRKARASVPADKYGWWWGTGRRKTGVARVRMKLAKDGKAAFEIESKSGKRKPFDQYFAEERDRNDCLAPLKVTGTEGKFTVIARVHGGGFMGQAGSVRLGLARALRAYDPSLEDALREAGFLTRDARKVERKKYGQAGARRRFQFSKR
ncbi:MAG: 30S ribosomal protein S9 [Phycisphaeraceae bacterium]|jgi:small subunit ribosomal protein S9|nr:30S ribosomal protein S9 [Phycisphaeraceae bacterium]